MPAVGRPRPDLCVLPPHPTPLFPLPPPSPQVCEHFQGTGALMTGRSLQTVKKSAPAININGKVASPLVILPEPAISIDLKMPAKSLPTKNKNIPTMSLIPNIILPEPDTVINLPLDKKPVGGQVNVVGSFKDKDLIVPILPEPKFVLEVPDLPKGPVLPKVNFNIEKVRRRKGGTCGWVVRLKKGRRHGLGG